MKVLESIIYHRILPAIEPRLFKNQYAYRRPRGTEHHLVSLQDRIRRELLRGRLVYIISFDVAGAFDTVAHGQLTAVPSG